MPANIVKPGQEPEWERAKAQVKKQYPDIAEGSERFYKLVTTIFQSMTKNKSLLAKVGALLKAKKPVQQPGSRGGKYWVDKQGKVRYGEKQESNKLTQMNQENIAEFAKHFGMTSNQIMEYLNMPLRRLKNITYAAWHEWNDSFGDKEKREQLKQKSNALTVLLQEKEMPGYLSIWNATKSLSSQVFELLKAKKPVQQPGKRGGKFWIDKQGKVQYGEKPTDKESSTTTRRTFAQADKEFDEFLDKFQQYKQKYGVEDLREAEIWARAFKAGQKGEKYRLAAELVPEYHKRQRETMELYAKEGQPTKSLSSQVFELLKAKKPIQQPGKRGGKFYRTKTGDVRYGEKPQERKTKISNMSRDELREYLAKLFKISQSDPIISGIGAYKDYIRYDMFAPESENEWMETIKVAVESKLENRRKNLMRLMSAETKLHLPQNQIGYWQDLYAFINGKRKLSEKEIQHRIDAIEKANPIDRTLPDKYPLGTSSEGEDIVYNLDQVVGALSLGEFTEGKHLNDSVRKVFPKLIKELNRRIALWHLKDIFSIKE